MLPMLSVAAIENGTVIDHIPAGQSLKIVQLLHLTKYKKKVTVGINLPSVSLIFKDLIKVEGREISEIEANQIALFAPQATINIVKEYQLIKKFTVSMPEVIEKIAKCPNARCITNHERIDTLFHITSIGNNIQLRCQYCSKTFVEEQLVLSSL